MGGYAPAGTVLKSDTQEKDIGVIVHESLKPTAQCRKAALKANQVLGQMRKSFHYRDGYLDQALKGLCASSLGICCPSMVSLAERRH